MVSPLLNKQWRFTIAVADLIYMAKCNGLNPKLVDVYRDPEWQKILLQRGKTKTSQSRHNINLAADLHLFDKYGRWLDGKRDTDYAEYKKLGTFWMKIGEDFVWGGDWDRNPATPHSFIDMVHFEVVP